MDFLSINLVWILWCHCHSLTSSFEGKSFRGHSIHFFQNFFTNFLSWNSIYRTVCMHPICNVAKISIILKRIPYFKEFSDGTGVFPVTVLSGSGQSWFCSPVDCITPLSSCMEWLILAQIGMERVQIVQFFFIHASTPSQAPRCL